MNLPTGLENWTLDRLKSVLFFLGKGGVGKTTLSTNFAIYLSKNGFKTYLISIDPAHNIADLLDRKFHKGPNEINSNLVAEELNIDLHLKHTLEKTENNLKEQYKYLQILNLENMFNIIKYSPGLQEYSIMQAIHETYNHVLTDFDYLIIDTPPTGLMMRIFNLPKLSLMWLEKLKSLRSKILEKRGVIAHLDKTAFKNDDAAITKKDDMVYKKLKAEIKLAQDIVAIYTGDISKNILITNEDRLSISEGLKIIDDLHLLDIEIDLIAVNKSVNVDINSGEKVFHKSSIKNYKKLLIPFYKSDVPGGMMLPYMNKMSHDLGIIKE